MSHNSKKVTSVVKVFFSTKRPEIEGPKYETWVGQRTYMQHLSTIRHISRQSYDWCNKVLIEKGTEKEERLILDELPSLSQNK